MVQEVLMIAVIKEIKAPADRDAAGWSQHFSNIFSDVAAGEALAALQN